SAPPREVTDWRPAVPPALTGFRYALAQAAAPDGVPHDDGSHRHGVHYALPHGPNNRPCVPRPGHRINAGATPGLAPMVALSPGHSARLRRNEAGPPGASTPSAGGSDPGRHLRVR